MNLYSSICCTVQKDLKKSLESTDILTEFRNIVRSLNALKGVLSVIPFHYAYSDILNIELSFLSNDLIPFINGTTGKMDLVCANDIDKINSYFDNQGICKQDFKASSFEIGNTAIGQLFDTNNNRKELFSVRIAAEHSIRSTASRWEKEAEKIAKVFWQI